MYLDLQLICVREGRDLLEEGGECRAWFMSMFREMEVDVWGFVFAPVFR